jgi:hypothetical protein
LRGVGWLGVNFFGFCCGWSIELATATFNWQIRPAVRIAGIKATSYGEKLTDQLLSGRKAKALHTVDILHQPVLFPVPKPCARL